ncbi:LeuA family protein [Halocatena marina]|uniref:LeuA family protein n=1 Tax=Halocatena marina TaxID=2934937 RepID=A0ABD5YHK7_9EURY|nr:LeuA family protein [Halocatena marina]
MSLCDVTLREAGQMPGRAYTIEQKIAAGTALDRLGLPLIQTGFPITGEHDTVVTRRLADTLEAEVVAIARAREDDIAAALESGADIIEVFIPISDRQLEAVIDDSRESAFDAAHEAIDSVRDGGAKAHLTLMDAFRTDAASVAPAFEQFDAPITLADTVGARTPPFVAGYLRTLAELGVSINRVGVHFHDDLGLATANALVSSQLGVDRVDVSVASLGERAGNPALEECVVAIEQDGDSGVVLDELVPVCRAVLDSLDETVDPRKAIIGEAVTAHESGLHTAAMLEDPATFEPYDPEMFGGTRQLLFGARTGQSAARELLERAEREPTDERIENLLERLVDDGPLELDAALEMAERVQ